MSTIKVDKRRNRSIPVFLLQHLLKSFNTAVIKPRKVFPAGSPKLEAPKKTKRSCSIEERIVEDIYIYDIRPIEKTTENGSTEGKKRRRLYYFAGGGWQMPPSSQHWTLCAELAQQLPDTTISLVSYPLAPHTPAPKAFPQMMKMYRRMLQDADEAGEPVTLAGDSAGANVILCLTLAALAEDASLPFPATLMAICPSCDKRGQNPDIKRVEKYDPILRVPFIHDTAVKWRGEWDAGDPRVTPLTADVSVLARLGVALHGVVGRYDILSPDAVLFREKCDQAGVHGEWLDWEKQMHCFPLAWSYKLPESVRAKDWIVDVLRRS